jgi:hypothetical protein
VPGTEGASLRLRVVSASLSYAFLQANKHRVILKYPMEEQEFSTGPVSVEVKLEPIGALWTCETDDSLKMLAANLLSRSRECMSMDLCTGTSGRRMW